MSIAARRAALALLALATAAGASFGMWRVLSVNGFRPLEWPVLPLFVVLVLPVAIAFWTAVIGFLVHLRGGDALSLARAPGAAASPGPWRFRTAIVIPAYHEDTLRLWAGLQTTYESVERTGRLACFDFFLLSDSTNPDTWVREELALTTCGGAWRIRRGCSTAIAAATSSARRATSRISAPRGASATAT